MTQVDEHRVEKLANAVGEYLRKYLPEAIAKRNDLADYRTNPYVLMTSASVMNLSDVQRLASFIFDNKLYMGLETSFGKSIESIVTKHYPLEKECWEDPPEKLEEFKALAGLSREEKAKRRTISVWREVDRSCVVDERRFLVSIKSGPNCINDTQVQGMQEAIARWHAEWLKQSAQHYKTVKMLDVIIGITYGTDQTTNNKENQILAKLLDRGFVEEDAKANPGVVIDSATKSVRVYRRVGQDFWAVIGNPAAPEKATHVFLEVLLGMAKALAQSKAELSLEERLKEKVRQLQAAFEQVVFPANTFPEWVQKGFSATELLWFAAAVTAFFDRGV